MRILSGDEALATEKVATEYEPGSREVAGAAEGILEKSRRAPVFNNPDVKEGNAETEVESARESVVGRNGDAGVRFARTSAGPHTAPARRTAAARAAPNAPCMSMLRGRATIQKGEQHAW